MKLPSKTEMGLILALGAREISGRDLAKRYQHETGKVISYGTLYTTLKRLKDGGWVESRDDEDADGRVRFFKLTGPGCSAQGRLIELQRTQDLLSGGGVVA